MNMLISLFNNTAGLLIATIVFCFLSYVVETSDPKSGLHKFTKPEVFFYYLILLLGSEIVNLRFEHVVDRIFFMILIAILAYHAYTDSKTNLVYRIFSLWLWGVGVIYIIIKLFIFQVLVLKPVYILAFLGGPLIFMVTMLLTSCLTGWLHGKGDGYILIGNAMFMQFLAVDINVFSIEPILYHYIAAAAFLIITNPKKISFKKARMKNRVAYAPSVLAGTLIVLFITAFLA